MSDARGADATSFLRLVAASVHGAVDPAALRAEGVDPASVTDFSSNQSPLGAAPGWPPPWPPPSWTPTRTRERRL